MHKGNVVGKIEANTDWHAAFCFSHVFQSWPVIWFHERLNTGSHSVILLPASKRSPLRRSFVLGLNSTTHDLGKFPFLVMVMGEYPRWTQMKWPTISAVFYPMLTLPNYACIGCTNTNDHQNCITTPPSEGKSIHYSKPWCLAIPR